MKDEAISVERNRGAYVSFRRKLHFARKIFIKKVAMQRSDCCTRTPQPQGLYHPRNEHDACGMGLVANIRGEKSHEIIRKGLEVLINLTHRGAAGCDPETGDGAGILIQIPHEFFARECGELGMQLPEAGAYGVAMCFLPVDKHNRLQCEGVFERIAQEEGLTVLGWRDTPVNGIVIGREARASQPYIEQLFLGKPEEMDLDEDAFERLLYRVRRRTENEMADSEIEGKEDFYIPSLSCRTIVYKGLMLAPQIEKFYYELANPLVKSALCLIHQRFSTNTFPSWKLAHPYRYLAHNGEINTIRGNISWMNARQSVLESPLLRRQDRRALSGHHARRQRLGFAGQRGGVPFSVGPLAAPRDGHAGSRSLVGQPRHGRGQARLLRVPRLADGALGRPGGALPSPMAA
jgi:glutamate synthase domain-containing protein 1